MLCIYSDKITYNSYCILYIIVCAVLLTIKRKKSQNQEGWNNDLNHSSSSVVPMKIYLQPHIQSPGLPHFCDQDRERFHLFFCCISNRNPSPEMRG